jgi:hypothetical protein
MVEYLLTHKLGENTIALPVKLQVIVDEMNMASDEMTAYINCKTGDLVTLTDEDVSYAEEDNDSLFIPDWQQETVDKAKQVLADDQYIELPGSYEIHEYEIMERFCHTVENERLKHVLLQAIKGRGAFRSFKDSIHRENFEKEWFAFKDSAFKSIAVDFLKNEGIPFTDNE